MIYEIHQPAFPLNQYVERFVYYKDYQPQHSLERFLPDGYTYVVFDFTEHPKYIFDNHTFKEIQSCRNVWFSGIREKYITISAGLNSEMFIIYFQKGKSYPFVEMPMHELTDCVLDGELVMSPEILNMRESLLSCQSCRQMFLFAEQYLTTTFRAQLVANPCVDYAVELILQQPQQISLRQLSAKVGYSQKHFIKIFKEHVGLAPKGFLKIIRFQKAMEAIENDQQLNWTDLALDCGYYDQAHFINDFKEFSGFTPAQLRQAKSDFSNYIPVG